MPWPSLRACRGFSTHVEYLLHLSQRQRSGGKSLCPDENMRRELSAVPEDLLYVLLDNPYDSLILIDEHGTVRFMSSSNEGVYAFPVRDAVGRHISEVSPHSRLLNVLKTGKAEIGRSMVVDGKNVVITRIPLYKDGRMVGAAGKLMLKNPRQLLELYERIDTLEKQLDYYKEELTQVYGSRYSFDAIIGDAQPLAEAKIMARQAASSDSPVLIRGESGTGKEVFAHAVHQAGKRRNHNFVRVNCAAIPAELIEAELFGYAPGAFTGAQRQGRAGKFELADKGTIFLDEIGDMPLNMQVKLMRVLQDKEVERLGGGKPRAIDFRVISATNRNLEDMLARETFRLDLYYRLNVVTMKLPALREIRQDIPLLFAHFLKVLSRERRGNAGDVSPEAMEMLRNYGWPGNMRELRNVAERALIVCDGKRIEVEHLPADMRKDVREPAASHTSPLPLRSLLDETERLAIVRALEKTGNNRVKAAELLGIHRTGLYQKMRKYRINENTQ